jgi:sortase A
VAAALQEHFVINNRRQPAREKRVPMGLALIIIGLLILGFGAIGWQALRGGSSGLSPLQAILGRPTVPSPANAAPGGAAAVLLPETPLDVAQFPSFATAAEAGRAPPPPVAGQPTWISIPALGVAAPVSAVSLHGVEIDGQRYLQWAVPPRYEAGWHQDSALLGAVGNTVLNGHNNTLGEVFRDLIELQPGDEIIVEDSAAAHTFRVAEVLQLPEQGQPLSVRLANAGWIEQTADERLTLVSCWPYATNSQRLIVVAYPVR